MDPRALARYADASDAELAARWNVPIEQLRLARAELEQGE
jgi:hypothetical protein